MRHFPGSPAVKISPSKAGGMGSIPGQAAKIPHALKPKNQNLNKPYCNHLCKFNKNFLKGPHFKNLLKKKTPILIKEPNNPQYKK